MCVQSIEKFTMKKNVLLFAILNFTLTGWAQTFYYNGLYYNTIGYGEVEVCRLTNPPKGSVTIPSSFVISNITYSVKAIGEYAFYLAKELTSVTIPSSVTSIGENAFRDCSSLTSVVFSNNSSLTQILRNAFSGCATLAFIELPPSLISIGNSAFSNCTSLSSISMHPTVKFIKEGAFINCTSLTSITIPSSVTLIEPYVFFGCTSLTSVTIPTSVTSIGGVSFEGCSSLSTVTIPSSVSSIGGSAFKGCSNLSTITIPSSITSIGGSAFEGCSTMSSIIIPPSVTRINDRTLWGCVSLTSVIIPSSVTDIGISAFENCTSLSSVFVSSSVKTIRNYAFRGCSALINVDSNNSNYSSKDGVLYDKNQTSLIHCPISISGTFSIPPSITSIANGAFRGCSVLINVDSNNPNYSSKEGILYSKNQTSLIQCPILINGSLSIPSSVTVIGNGALYCCTALTSVTIPPSVTSIQESAFWGCSSLTSVFSFIVSPTHLSSGQFVGVDTTMCELYVPIGSKFLYVSATGWKDFSKITESLFAVGSNFSVDGINYNCDGIYTVAIISKQNFNGTDIPSKVTYLDVDYQITSIGNGVFEYYTNFVDIVIPKTVTKIGNFTFNSCSNLKSIELPAGIQTIGNYSFYNCTSLTSINVISATPPALGTDAFSLVDKFKCILNVPAGSINAYKSTNQWKDFFNIIEYNPTGIENENIPLLNLYPNPVKDYVIISGIQNGLLRIVDLNGRLILEQRIIGEDTINLRNFVPGVYMYRVQSAGGSQNGKIVKE